MYFQFSSSWKSLSTVWTLIGFFPRVCLHMVRQTFMRAVSLVTQSTGIRLLLCVGSSVCSQMAWHPKAFSTELTLEWALSSMKPCMDQQCPWSRETLTTERTLVGSLTSVQSLMSDEDWVLDEPLPTDWAAVGSLARVHTYVIHQSGPTLKCLATVRAKVGSFPCVSGQMFF